MAGHHNLLKIPCGVKTAYNHIVHNKKVMNCRKVLKLVFACQIHALQYIVVVVNSSDKMYDVVQCVVYWLWLVRKARVKKGLLKKLGFLAHMRAYVHLCRLT